MKKSYFNAKWEEKNYHNAIEESKLYNAGEELDAAGDAPQATEYAQPFRFSFINTTGADLTNPVILSLRNSTAANSGTNLGVTIAYLSGGIHTTLANWFAQWNNGMVANVRMISIRCAVTAQVYESYGYSYASSGAEYYENSFYPEQSENQNQAGVKNLIVPKFIITSNLEVIVSRLLSGVNSTANALYISLYPDLLSSKVGAVMGRPAQKFAEPVLQAAIPYKLK